MSNRITNAKARMELRATEAQSRLIALTEEPELGGARNTDEGFHIGIGAAAAGAVGIAVAAFVAKKMGALG